MMVHRLASAIGGDSTDDWTFVAFVVYSFFFIVLVQLIGILLGDRSPIQVPPLLPSESSNLCSVVHISDRPNVRFGRTVRPNFYCAVRPKSQNFFLQNTELFSRQPFIFLFCLMIHMFAALSLVFR